MRLDGTRQGAGGMLMDEAVSAALAKIRDRGALDERDWIALTSGHELIALGVAADEARRRRHADRVTFVQVCEIPLATVEGVDTVPDQAGELRVSGRPASAEAAIAAVRAVAERAGSVPVTGYALEDLLAVCDDDTGRLGEMLIELRRAGLAMVTELAADALTDPEPVFAVLQASDMVVARVSTGAATGAALHALTRRVGSWDGAGTVCRSFAPLPRAESSPPSTGYTDLRQVALARLLVDNIDAIQLDWPGYGPKLAQVALTFGADDVDAVPAVASPDRGWRRSPREEIRRNIAAAGFVAVRRDGRFEAQAERDETPRRPGWGDAYG